MKQTAKEVFDNWYKQLLTASIPLEVLAEIGAGLYKGLRWATRRGHPQLSPMISAGMALSLIREVVDLRARMAAYSEYIDATGTLHNTEAYAKLKGALDQLDKQMTEEKARIEAFRKQDEDSKLVVLSP